MKVRKGVGIHLNDLGGACSSMTLSTKHSVLASHQHKRSTVPVLATTTKQLSCRRQPSLSLWACLPAVQSQHLLASPKMRPCRRTPPAIRFSTHLNPSTARKQTLPALPNHTHNAFRLPEKAAVVRRDQVQNVLPRRAHVCLKANLAWRQHSTLLMLLP